ncbi:MAG: response regulator transcription factor [Nocardioides sp.]|nr:response regulator transcription factor [Nocardioides sp.]
MSSRPCLVSIVSPLEVITTGLRSMLAQHPERVSVVQMTTGPDAVDPDVILYDVMGLNDGDGADLENLVARPGSAVLAVGQDLRPDLGSRALALGADGFFSITVDDEALLAAVESATTGWEPGDPGQNPIVGSSDRAAAGARLGHEVGLTPREVDVLTMITGGLTNQDIAQQSYLSINSVKTYIRSAYRRIGVSSRSQAVVWCLQHGFSADAASSERRA